MYIYRIMIVLCMVIRSYVSITSTPICGSITVTLPYGSITITLLYGSITITLLYERQHIPYVGCCDRAAPYVWDVLR